MNTEWHFFVMILASLLVFWLIIKAVVSKELFQQRKRVVMMLAFIVVVLGMLFGKYGASAGLPWWIYYPVPMLLTVFLPPAVLKIRGGRYLLYLLLSFLSAPLIHFLFSFFLGCTEYMPFWKIPSMVSLM